jgi:hypothetical protein
MSYPVFAALGVLPPPLEQLPESRPGKGQQAGVAAVPAGALPGRTLGTGGLDQGTGSAALGLDTGMQVRPLGAPGAAEDLARLGPGPVDDLPALLGAVGLHQIEQSLGALFDVHSAIPS